MKFSYLILSSFLLLSFIIPVNSIDYQIIKKIETINVRGIKTKDIESIIVECLIETTNDLSFKLKSNSSHVDKTKIGNCVGYTKYFNKLFISKLNKNNYGNISVTHARVKVLIMGTNIHLINSKSLKDHDISVIYNKTDNKTYLVDPSLSEVFGNIIVKR